MIPFAQTSLRMAPLYPFRGFLLLFFCFLRCLVRFEQRQELLSPNASNENALELSSRLAYDPLSVTPLGAGRRFGNTAHDNLRYLAW